MSQLSVKRPGWKPIVFLICAIGIFCACLLWLLTHGRGGGAGPVSVSAYPIEKRVSYSFTLQNKTGRVLEEAELWTYAPLPVTSTQKCLHVKASHPHERTQDDLGNEILHFVFDQIAPYDTKIVSIEALLAMSESPNGLSLPDRQRFLSPETYVESDDPDLLETAEQVTRIGKKVLSRAKSLYQWVADNVAETGYVSRDRGALQAFRSRQGDCTESAYLFVALCRASGIPARGLGGYVCANSCILKPGAYHDWAEFYAQGTWHLSDPNRRVFNSSGSDYIAMEVLGEVPGSPMKGYHRFRFSGEGLTVRMNRQ